MDNLIFRASAGELLVILLLLVIGCFLIAKSHAGKGMGAALWTKLSALFLISFLLLKPEVKKELPQESNPQLLILRDATPSMETQDLPAEGEMQSRSAGVTSFLKSAEWKDFSAQTEFRITEESFGAGEGETDLSSALAAGTAADAILLLSDGAWNAGDSPVGISQQLRKERIPVYAIMTGVETALPDVSVESVSAPLLVETAETFSVNLTLRSSYKKKRTRTLLLKRGDEVLEERSVELLPQQSVELTLRQEIPAEGVYPYTVEIAGDETEVTLENNSQSFTVTARAQQIKVLLVDTLPRWEYRFIRNAMMRDPKVDVSCLLLHPELPPAEGPHYLPQFPTEAELSAYDVILIGDIGIGEKQLTEENALSIVKAVKENASGLMLLPGSQGWQGSLMDLESFRSLYPVEVTGEFGGVDSCHNSPLKLSAEGETSLLLSLNADPRKNRRIWDELPGFSWYQPVSAVKSGSQVLAFHAEDRNESGRVPVIVTGRSGRGKVLWMGIDSSYKWRRGVEDLYHYRFWRQLARWMAYQRNLTAGDQAKLFLNTDAPLQGKTFPFHLQAMTADGKPAPLEKVELILETPGSDPERLPLYGSKNWGEFHGEISFQTAGDNTLKVRVDGAEVARRDLSVIPKKTETLGEPADAASLNEISRLTRALSVSYPERYSLLPHLTQAATPPPRHEFLPLNTHWGWYVGIISLLCASWILRRKVDA